MKKVFNFRSKPEAVLEKKLHKCDSNVAIGSAADQNSDQEESSSKQGSSKQMGLFQPRFDLVDFSSQGLLCLQPIQFYRKRGDFFHYSGIVNSFFKNSAANGSLFPIKLCFRKQLAEFFFSKKNRQLKAGQNNKHDMTLGSIHI